jgi:putative pyruvate formate lyase activating enzyme
VRHAESLGYRNCFIQIGETAESKFIPVFDGTNVLRASD